MTGPVTSDVTGLLVTDVDSTFIRQECIELLAARAGAEAEVRDVTERAMRGELDFAASLRERVALLAGLPVSVFYEVAAEVELTPGAAELVAHAHERGWAVALVSGGFHEVVDVVGARAGVDHVLANRLEVEGDRLTGRTTGPIIDRTAKAEALRFFAAQDGVATERTVAVGDGANDIDLLEAAGTGIAFRAKPALRAIADHAVDEESLLAVARWID